MPKLFTLIFSLIIVSCTTNTENDDTLKTISAVVNTDSCIKWDLQNVNFELEYPKNYTAEYNVNGYYLRLRKMDGDTILQEIVFGNAGGKTIDFISGQLNYIDSAIRMKFEHYGQHLVTSFIGKADFVGRTTPQIKTNITVTNFQLEGQKFIMNGKYFTLVTFIDSPLDSLQVVALTVSSNMKELYREGNEISIENETILKTLKFN